MSDFTIIPSSLQYKSAPTLDQQINIPLESNQEEMVQYVRNTTISLQQLYEDERQTSLRFRPTFKIDFVYDNTYTGTTEYAPFRDELYYVEPIQSKVSGVWKGFPQYYEFDFFRPNIPTGHLNYVAKSAYTYNWTYYITYPYQNDYTKQLQATYDNRTINWVAQEGIPFIISSSVEGGLSVISFQCLMPHGLVENQFVELSFDYEGQKVFDVFSLGNTNYGSSDYVFNIINVGYTGNTFFNGRTGTFRRIIDANNPNETRSKYYIRQHRVLKNQSEIEITKTGFELNAFQNQKKLEFSSITPNNVTRVSQKTSSFNYDFTLSNDLILSGLTNNLKQEVNEIYLTIVNKGYSGYFNKPINNNVGLKQGWLFNINRVVSSWWDDNNTLSNSNIGVLSYSKTTNRTYTFYYNRVLNEGDVLDGDFCEFNDYYQVERVVSPYVQKIKFNQNIFATVNQPNSNPQGYYYFPHLPMTLKYYSDYVETAPAQQVENIPSWAFFSTTDQQFRWREPYLYGEFDNLDRGVNYPYLNRAHYPFENTSFKLFPEGSNYQAIPDGVNLDIQPLIDDCE